MPDINTSINRENMPESLVPEQISKEIIQEAPKSSVLLSRARRVPLSRKQARQPVLSVLPSAYWVNGDDGLKQTTGAEWKDTFITAEELATIVIIPDALFDDSDVPLWDEVRPLLFEAVGTKVDSSGLFGEDKPESWPQGIVPAAIAAGNTITKGTGADFGVDVALLGQMIKKQGYGINGFASVPGLQWELTALRNTEGTPIYTNALSTGGPSGLYGYPLDEVDNGAWDESQAELLAADWSKFVIGVRQDFTYQIFDTGVISDNTGKVLYNLMQQDAKAMRVVFRVGFQVAKPLTRIGGENRFPAGIIAPAV